MGVHSATCVCIIELNEKWYTFAGFFQTGIFRGFFLYVTNLAGSISEAAMGAVLSVKEPKRRVRAHAQCTGARARKKQLVYKKYIR